MKDFRTHWWIFLIGCAWSHGVGCVESQPLLPGTDEVFGWTKVGDTRIFTASNLWEYINGDAERYVRAGVEKTLTSDYLYQEKTESVVDIYVMSTPAGAREIFESESSSSAQKVQVGEIGELSGSSLKFFQGVYLVRVVAYQEGPDLKNALLDMARVISLKLR